MLVKSEQQQWAEAEMTSKSGLSDSSARGPVMKKMLRSGTVEQQIGAQIWKRGSATSVVAVEDGADEPAIMCGNSPANLIWAEKLVARCVPAAVAMMYQIWVTRSDLQTAGKEQERGNTSAARKQMQHNGDGIWEKKFQWRRFAMVQRKREPSIHYAGRTAGRREKKSPGKRLNNPKNLTLL